MTRHDGITAAQRILATPASSIARGQEIRELAAYAGEPGMIAYSEVRRDEDRWKHGAIIDMHAQALEVERRRQVLAWLEHRGVGRTPTPGTVARGVLADHVEAIRLNQIKHFQTIRDRIRTTRLPSDDRSIVDVLHLHAIVEDRRRTRLARPTAVLAPQIHPVGPCANGCTDPAAHAEGYHDV
jgi:hypothetical protein